MVDRILTYRPFCAAFGWITVPPPASPRSPFFHQSDRIVTRISQHGSPLVSTKRENCCRFVFSSPLLTFKAFSGGQNSSFGKSWQTGRVVTTAVAFTGSSAGRGQNLRVDQVEICLCAKIHPDPSFRCCVKLFQSWSLSSGGGGRTAHSGFLVCGGRQVLRWTRAVPGRGLDGGPALYLPRHPPLLCRAAAAQRRLRPSPRRQLWTESVRRQGLGRSVWWAAGLAQGQEILNKMRAAGSQVGLAPLWAGCSGWQAAFSTIKPMTQKKMKSQEH